MTFKQHIIVRRGVEVDRGGGGSFCNFKLCIHFNNAAGILNTKCKMLEADFIVLLLSTI